MIFLNYFCFLGRFSGENHPYFLDQKYPPKKLLDFIKCIPSLDLYKEFGNLISVLMEIASLIHSSRTLKNFLTLVCKYYLNIISHFPPFRDTDATNEHHLKYSIFT